MASPSSTKSNKKGAKRSRSKSRLVMVMMLCLVSWAGVIYWDQQGKLAEKRAEFNELEEQLKLVHQSNEKAKKEVERLNDKEYIEQKIRKELNYVKEGERIFSVTQP
ncbi:septum formation initiator family protein [Paenibacillus albiflavus]|uniref:Septum formation initiator family protein n=1 Tax=Paenibacillus albiflavus TaxID=2545760 RepID=A0A4R4E4E2_9BACL|nr:septum formation initiator family protein [Paenibacillus albiflavus]TCZ74329.1 septum formation initiator family protein [Paenibacillus albiflavus]